VKKTNKVAKKCQEGVVLDDKSGIQKFGSKKKLRKTCVAGDLTCFVACVHPSLLSVFFTDFFKFLSTVFRMPQVLTGAGGCGRALLQQTLASAGLLMAEAAYVLGQLWMTPWQIMGEVGRAWWH